MPTEIERKFLVTGDEWRQGNGTRFVQGYLSRDKECTVRVRLAGEKAYLTIKGISTGFSRAEFEYEIPVPDAEQLLKLCNGPVVHKVRYIIDYRGSKWEVDEFLGENTGLVIAEIELKSEDQPIEKPAWIGKEVTHDPRYYNSNLSTNPFNSWR